MQKIKSHRRWMVFFGILTVMGIAFFVEPSLAQGEPVGEANWFVSALSWVMLTIANLALQLTIFFLRFFIMIASYNNYIDVDVVQLGWIMVRDLANMFFVVALLVIAFGTILGLEEYEWKKNLVKLILSAIVINFSNLIAQLIIDVAHVFSITFLNAISATAGGNIINMFKLDQITKLATGDTGSINLELFAASVMGMMFALMACFAMGSYLFVMAVRVVALWALIIMSPLAFVLGVLPKTKTYAEKWWSEFTKYVIVAPIMVFFLWLSFATLGLGNIADQIQQSGIPASAQLKQSGFEGQVSIAKVTSWENMANFFIALVFMMYGIKATQETGVEGSNVVGSAAEAAKTVGKYASGYMAARWMGGKARDGLSAAASGIGTGVYDLTIANRVERTGNWFKKQYAGLKDYRNGGPLARTYKKGESAAISVQELDVDKNGNYVLSKADAQRGWELKRHSDGTYEKVATKELTDMATDKNGQPVFRSWLQKSLYASQLKLTQSRKELEKVENSAERRQEMMDKSIEAQPEHLFKSRLFGKKEINKDLDRLEMGMLEAMEERSSAKTGQFKATGREMILGRKRYKTESAGGALREAAAALIPIFGGHNLDSRNQNEKDTIIEQIASHEIAKESTEKQIANIAAIARNKVLSANKRGEKSMLQGKIKAELEVKAQEALTSKTEALAKTEILNADKTNVLDRTIAAEKAAHLESIKHERLEKAADRKFLQSEHGRLELEEEADLQNQIGEIQNSIDGLTTEAKNRVTLGKGGLTDEEIEHEAHGDEKKANKLLWDRMKLQQGYKARSDAFLRSGQTLQGIKDEETSVTDEATQRVKNEDQIKKEIQKKAIEDALDAASLHVNEADQKKAFKEALAKGLKAGAVGKDIVISDAELNLSEAKEREVYEKFQGSIESRRLAHDKTEIDRVTAEHQTRQSAVDELKRAQENYDTLNKKSTDLVADPKKYLSDSVGKVIEKIKAGEKEIVEMSEAKIEDQLVTALKQAEIAQEASPGDAALAEKLVAARKAVADDAKKHGFALDETKLNSASLEEEVKNAKKIKENEKKAALLVDAQKMAGEILHSPGLISDDSHKVIAEITNNDDLAKKLGELVNDTAANDFVVTNAQVGSVKLRKQAEEQLEKVIKRLRDAKDLGKATDLSANADALELDLDLKRLQGLDAAGRERIFKFKPFAAGIENKTDKAAIGRDLSVLMSRGALTQEEHDSLQEIATDATKDVSALRTAIFDKFKGYQSYQNLASKYGKAGEVPAIDELVKRGKVDLTNATVVNKQLSARVAEDTKNIGQLVNEYRKKVTEAYSHAVAQVHGGAHPHLTDTQIDALVENPNQVTDVYLESVLPKTALERSTRAKKRAHTADLFGKAIDKKVERRDSISYEGQHEIELDAQYENEVEAVDNFTKDLKNKIVKDKFKQAKDAMKKIIDEYSKDRKEMVKLLNQLSEKSGTEGSFVRKLRSTVLTKLGEEAHKEQADLAEEFAKAGFYEIPVLSKATPSTAMDSRIANAAKDLKGMEAQDGGASAARWVASIMRQKRELKTQGRDIDNDSKARLFAAITHITNEAWTDDTIAEITALFQDLDSGKINLNTDDGRDIQEMKEIFVNQLGLIKKNEQGEYKSYSDPKNSAALQALVATGGDLDFVNSHNWVGAVSDSVKEKDYSKKGAVAIKADLVEKLRVKEGDTQGHADIDKIVQLITTNKINSSSGYEEVAKVLADDTGILKKFNIGSFKAFDEALDGMQELLQEASSQFKRAALNAKHLQNGGHQAYDARWGGSGRYRLMTIGESQAIMKAETVKREGMQNAQHHSYGTIDNNTGRLVGIDKKMFGILTAAILDSNKANVLTRTLDNLMGYGSGEAFKKNADGMSMLGGDAKQMRDLLGDFIKPGATDAEVSRVYFEKMIKPALESNAQAFQLLISKKNSISNVEANQGKVNIAFDLGNGKSIKAENYSEFLEQIKEHFGDQMDKDFNLNGIIQSYKLKEREGRNPQNKKAAKQEEANAQ